MNKLTALALLIAVIAAWSYSAGKRSVKPIQASAPAEPTKPLKSRKIVVDVQPLPDIPTRFGSRGSTARERSNQAFAEAVRARAERSSSNGNR